MESLRNLFRSNEQIIAESDISDIKKRISLKKMIDILENETFVEKILKNDEYKFLRIIRAYFTLDEDPRMVMPTIRANPERFKYVETRLVANYCIHRSSRHLDSTAYDLIICKINFDISKFILEVILNYKFHSNDEKMNTHCDTRVLILKICIWPEIVYQINNKSLICLLIRKSNYTESNIICKNMNKKMLASHQIASAIVNHKPFAIKYLDPKKLIQLSVLDDKYNIGLHHFTIDQKRALFYHDTIKYTNIVVRSSNRNERKLLDTFINEYNNKKSAELLKKYEEAQEEIKFLKKKIETIENYLPEPAGGF